jgi:hypothetical protein
VVWHRVAATIALVRGGQSGAAPTCARQSAPQRLSWVAALPLTWAAAACFEVAASIFHSGQRQVPDNSWLSYALTSDSSGSWDAVAPENVQETGGYSPARWPGVVAAGSRTSLQSPCYTRT